MYCLKVVISCPDYKRPYSKVIVEHFGTEDDAKTRLNEIKTEYIEDHYLTKDIFNFEHDEQLISIPEFDKLVENGGLLDYIYSDSYMDQPPFESEIIKIEI